MIMRHWAPQEPEIFKSTIEDNITMGLAATKKEIQEAIEIARFDTAP